MGVMRRAGCAGRVGEQLGLRCGLRTCIGRHSLPYDPDFEAAMVLLTGSPDISARLGRAGRSYVEREFAWSHVSEQFLDVAAGVAEVNGRTVERASRVLG